MFLKIWHKFRGEINTFLQMKLQKAFKAAAIQVLRCGWRPQYRANLVGTFNRIKYSVSSRKPNEPSVENQEQDFWFLLPEVINDV